MLRPVWKNNVRNFFRFIEAFRKMFYCSKNKIGLKLLEVPVNFHINFNA
jgi:hypothetical protein